MIEQFNDVYATYGNIITRTIASIVIILGVWFVCQLLLRFINRQEVNTDTVYAWNKTTEIVGLVLTLIALFSVWFSDRGFQSASTYFGLLSAGIAISLQEPLVNVIGWLFIVVRRPFEVGHRVEVGDVAGDVINVQFFHFTLLEIGNWVAADQSTGRVIRVPNRMVFNGTIANYTSGISFIWNEIVVEVTFESDWRRAKVLLQQIADKYSLEPTSLESAEIRKTARKSNIRLPQLTPIIYTKVVSTGVDLTLRYLCRPRDRRNSEQRIWEAILDTFSEEDTVDFAYPTQRLFYHPHEGKTLLRDHTEVSHPRFHGEKPTP